jgi:hypothetical protein
LLRHRCTQPQLRGCILYAVAWARVARCRWRVHRAAEGPRRGARVESVFRPAAAPQVTVLVMSLCFIGFVTVLHAAGKVFSFRK